MLSLIQNILTTVFGSSTRLSWQEDHALRSYFRSEYKKDSKAAYEYWQTTGKCNFSA